MTHPTVHMHRVAAFRDIPTFRAVLRDAAEEVVPREDGCVVVNVFEVDPDRGVTHQAAPSPGQHREGPPGLAMGSVPVQRLHTAGQVRSDRVIAGQVSLKHQWADQQVRLQEVR